MRIFLAELVLPAHRAVAGIVFETDIPSSREEDLSYRVRLAGDGSWECSCPGFRYGARADRLCKHVDTVKAARERPVTFAVIMEPTA